MQDFIFDNHTRLIFGRDTEQKTGELISHHSKKILVCSYGDADTTGIVKRVISTLYQHGVDYASLSGIKPNPELCKVLEGVEIVRKNNIDFILAIGGGSIIDTAKAIAAGVSHKGEIWDLFTGNAKFEKALPTGVVLTIPATGSESSNGAVITNEKTKQKMAIIHNCLRPVFAILNPELSFSLPKYQTFCGIADIMSHVMERYFSKTRFTDLTDRLCESILKTVIRNAVILLDEPMNYEARAEIMFASTLAHNDLVGMGRSQDWVSHYIGMEISAVYDTTHGATLSVITPAWAKYVYRENINRFVQFAMNVFGIEYDFMNPEKTASEGIYALESFFRRLGLPTKLEEIKIIDESRFEEMANKYMLIGPFGDMKKIFKEDFINILRLAKS